jgi:diguanylate cyclase (GGDEF)-like protein
MEFLHISLRNVNWQLLAGISTHYAIDGLALTPADDVRAPAVPLVNNAGEQLAKLHWQPDEPGKATIMLLAPPFIVAVLLGSIMVAFLLRRLWRSTTLIEASERQTRFLALHDPLTGLPNRTLFENRIEAAIAGLADLRNGRIALHLIDIDRFKNVNDTMGHPVGDELVRQIAGRLSSVLSPADTIARIGGDEFAVVQAGVHRDDAVEALAERLGAVIRNPFDLDGEHVLVTASIGIVVSEAKPTTRAELLRRADIALYEAKSRGRGRHIVFRDEMDSAIRHRRAIERDLRAALASGRGLHVDYQPLFAADGVTVLGAEALVRWHHPTLGALPPDLFIDIAEERGLIESLGDWVLEEACAVLTATGIAKIAVNVSPLQLRREGFSQHILSLLRRRGVAPERVELEVTEGVLIEQGPLAEWALSELRDQGVSVVLDDFGTGYSSMSYLHRYEVDKIKIDKSFVRRLGASSSADAIVRAIVSLARAMNRRVTAEGVETEEQRERLVALGCDELQGFLLCRPLSAEALAEFLGRQATRLTA